jgi:Acetyltransferase (GNAT) domain
MRRVGVVTQQPEGLARTAWLKAKAGFGRVTEAAQRVRARGDTLSVQWFDGWNGQMEAALAAMPELPNCPHELYRRLLSEPSSVARRWAIVYERGEPVAVVGLRKKGKRWEPICQGVCPGAYIAAKPGYLVPALKAMRLPTIVQYWEDEPVPPGARNVISYTSHRISCIDGEAEATWKQSGMWKGIRNIRQRCKALTVELDQPGADQWVLHEWAGKWADHPWDDVVTLDSMLLAVETWRKGGQLHTFRLMDGETPAAGLICLAAGPRLVALTIYRDAQYDWHGAGIRILDVAFQWGREAGLQEFDLGGGAGFKERLAPAACTIWEFEFLPFHTHALSMVSSFARRGARKGRRAAQRIRTLSPAGRRHHESESHA